jgi:hypothetical protein
VSELALLLIVLLVIPGSTPQSSLAQQRPTVANITTTGTTNNNTQTYSNPLFGIQMQYPSNWLPLDLSHNSSSILILAFRSPAGVNPSGSLNILGQNVSSGNVTLTALVSTNINHLKQTGKILSLISSTPAVFAGYPAHKITYITISSQLNEFEVMQIISLVGNKAYFVSYAAPIATYTTYLPTIQTMISSIKIIK